MTCPFCDHSHSFLESSLSLARLDKYPVSPGHTLITTKRHISSYFEATPDEVSGLWQLVGEVKQYLDSKHQPTGYNIGINVGADAGQTVMHMHIHIIPRYKGDMEDPRGGVRGVIPNKQKY
jgi:diadenosine tetraphosphate (Ap4A) HIT family hydrolase